jgi:hypothetical protein
MSRQPSGAARLVQMFLILHLWQQAQCNHMQLAPLQGHGWTRDRDGKFDIYRRKQVQSEEQGRLTNEGVQL